MTRITFTTAFMILGLLACSPIQNSTSPIAKVITLEVGDNQVLLLDNKEVHVDYLSSVLTNLNTEFDLSAELIISPDAQMGIVYDVQKALFSNAIQNNTDE